MKAVVLIVDEDRNVCEPLTKALRQEGYEALLAYDGVEAVGLYRRHLPEVVLLAALGKVKAMALFPRRLSTFKNLGIVSALSALDAYLPPFLLISLACPTPCGSAAASYGPEVPSQAQGRSFPPGDRRTYPPT